MGDVLVWLGCSIVGGIQGLFMPTLDVDSSMRDIIEANGDRFPVSFLALGGIVPGGCVGSIGIPLGGVTMTLLTTALSGWLVYFRYFMYCMTAVVAWHAFRRLFS